MLRIAFVLPILVASLACSVSTAVPVAVKSAPVAVDIDAQRAAFEQALCAPGSAVASHSCRVLTALDASDGVLTSPPALPALLPLSIVAGSETVHVPSWLEQERAVHDFVPKLAVPVSLPVTAQNALKHAQIDDATVVFDDDTLTLDLPELVVEVDGEKVGVVAPHAAGSGEASAVSLVEGGATKLLGARDVSVVPSSEALGLLAGPDGSIERPGGHANVSLALSLEIDERATLDVGVHFGK